LRNLYLLGSGIARTTAIDERREGHALAKTRP